MCGGSGGDGGYAARQEQLRQEQERAIAEVNTIFGRGQGAPIYGTRPIYGEAPTYSDDNGTTVGAVPVIGQEQYVTGYDPATRDANLAERERLYGTIAKDSEARLLDNLGRDRTRAERGVRFQLARQGLGGGSVDIDQNREVLDGFQRGSLEARNAATQAANTARSGDERTRVNLIGSIRDGMSQSDAIQSAYAGMQNNANEARDAGLATNIGNFFDDISILRNQAQFAAGQDQARARYGTRNISGSSATAGGNNGRVS